MELRRQLESYVPCCDQEACERRLILSYMDRFDDLLLRSNDLLHFTASGWIVNPARTHVLLAYHNLYDSWAWTGGHADGDGNLLRVAMREAREEAGLETIRPITEDVYSVEILNVNAHVRRGKYVAPHLHLNLTFLLEADDRQLIRSKPDENSAVRWFPLNEVIPASSEPEMHAIYRKLNEKLSHYK